MKKNTVKGFGAHYIDENMDEEKMPKEISVEESLVAMIYDRYEPVNSLPESTDQKTTIELVDEMESTADVSRNAVKKAMEGMGFKLHYTGSEYVWILRERLRGF